MNVKNSRTFERIRNVPFVTKFFGKQMQIFNPYGNALHGNYCIFRLRLD